MKKYFLFLFCLLFVGEELCAQSSASTVSLYVNHRQQLLLQFPAAVQYVDFGSPYLRGKKMLNARYVSVQAIRDSMPETTLSAVTAEGKYYSYKVLFQDRLPGLVYQVQTHSYLPSQPLWVSAQKTTHFVSPHPIADWVVGSDSLLVAPASGIENILRLKALCPFGAPSSIALLSPTGEWASYVVHYSDSASQLSAYLGEIAPNGIQFQHSPVDTLALRQAGQMALQQPYQMNHCGVYNHKLLFSLVGIYSWQDYLLFRLVLQNKNNIDYAIDFMKVYIKDRKNTQYAALQEMEIQPLYGYFPQRSLRSFLPARGQMECLLFFDRFTLPKERILTLELFEKNGGRHLQFSVSHKDLLRAARLPQQAASTEPAEKKNSSSPRSAVPPKKTKKVTSSSSHSTKKEPSWEEDSFW